MYKNQLCIYTVRTAIFKISLTLLRTLMKNIFTIFCLKCLSENFLISFGIYTLEVSLHILISFFLCLPPAALMVACLAGTGRLFTCLAPGNWRQRARQGIMHLAALHGYRQATTE